MPLRPAAIAGAVALAAALFLALTACPTVFFGDSAELIAAADSLGVAHPPGYPLYTLLGRLALMLPAGEPAWRMNLLSALFAGLSCGCVAWLIARWTGSRIAAAGAGLAWSVSATHWSVATVAEVYTLHLLLVTLLLVCAVGLGGAPTAASRARWWIALGATLGLGLAHRPTILLALPAAVVLAWPLREAPRGEGLRGRTWICGAVLALGLPGLFYGTLMLRSLAGPAANWGRPDNLAALWALVTTQAYGHYRLGPAGWLRAAGWEQLGRLAWDDLGYLGLPLALLGLSTLIIRRQDALRRPALALLLLAAATGLFGLSYATPDVEVLWLPLMLTLALSAGLGDMLHGLPAAAVLFVEGDDAFLLAYRIQVLGERPDVTIYDRTGALFHDELRETGSAPRRGEAPQAFRVRRELEYIARELRSERPRPLLFMSWPGYELPPALRFEPEGLFYRVRRSSAAWAEPGPLWGVYHERSIRAQAERLGNPLALTVAATYPLMRGERERFVGDWPAASRSFEEAGRLARSSESIHNYLGTLYGRRGEYARAIEEFERAVEIMPASVRAWNNLALARSFSGDGPGAREAWERSLRLEARQPDVVESLRRAVR